MSSNSIYSSTFTEIELSIIAMVLYLFISPIHGITKITKPLKKILKIKSNTSLLLFTGLLFGIIYHFSIQYILTPIYKQINNNNNNNNNNNQFV
tara:strand:- start:562 stop:843 length:282 start_codon:yes stop_codon:yes gene_type:complete